MPAAPQQKIDSLGIALVGVGVLAVAGLSFVLPAMMPWGVVAMAVAAVGMVWIARWDVAVWAWLWVLSYGMFDRPFWLWNIPGFFNLTIPRLVFLWAAGLMGLGLIVRRQAVRCDRSLLWAMSGLLVYIALNTTLAGWVARQSSLPTAPYYRFIEALLFPYVIFFLVYKLAREKQIPMVLVILSLYGWYALYIGYLQYAANMGMPGLRSLIWPDYINKPEWAAGYGIHFDRARGAYTMANPQALLLIILFYADLFLINRIKGLHRWVFIIQAILIPPAIFFTGLRSAYLAWLVGGVVWVSIGRLRRFPKSKLAVAALALVVMVAVFWGNVAGTDRAKGGVAQKAPVVGRMVLAARTWEIFKKYPIFGSGFGHYLEAEYQLKKDPGQLGRLGTGLATPHNLFLVMLAETGIVGLAGILAVLFLLFRLSVRFYRSLPDKAEGFVCRPFVALFWVAMVAYLVDAMLVDPLWDVPSNGLFWSLAGLMAGVAGRLETPAVHIPNQDSPAAT